MRTLCHAEFDQLMDMHHSDPDKLERLRDTLESFDKPTTATPAVARKSATTTEHPSKRPKVTTKIPSAVKEGEPLVIHDVRPASLTSARKKNQPTSAKKSTGKSAKK
jgi:hypothetical protein